MDNVIELRRGGASLRLAPRLGGRVTALRLDAGAGPRDVLAPFPEDATDLLRWPKGGLYPLIPYGNRIGHARLEAFGAALRPHPDALPHTLHGPAHRDAWTVAEHGEATATLRLDRAADDEWPWRFEGVLRFDLPSADRVRIAIGLVNRAGRAMPAGLGLHPYFAHEPHAVISLLAELDWPVAPDGLAGAPRAAEAIRGPLAEGEITIYRSGWDGRVAADLPGGGRALLARVSGPLDHLVLHRPAGGAYLCLEPMTHVADAFNLDARAVRGTGAAVLAPREGMEAEVEIALVP